MDSSTASHTSPDLSVVIPLYDEVENVEALYQELHSVLEVQALSYEVVFVDDGSRDGTLERLESVTTGDGHVVILRLARNYGQSAALAAGFDEARGEVIVAMDGDGQEDPADIPRLVAQLRQGYDIVSGWRRNRQDSWLNRRLPSMAANWLISRLTGLPLHDYGCTLKAYRCWVAKELPLQGELHRYIPALALPLGIEVSELEVSHRPRTRGDSKYGWSRLFKVVMDLIAVKFLLSYVHRPLHIFGGLGLLALALSLAAALATAVMKWGYQIDITGNPIFLIGILFFLTGLICILMGLIADLQSRAFQAISGERPYRIAHRILQGAK